MMIRDGLFALSLVPPAPSQSGTMYTKSSSQLPRLPVKCASAENLLHNLSDYDAPKKSYPHNVNDSYLAPRSPSGAHPFTHASSNQLFAAGYSDAPGYSDDWLYNVPKINYTHDLDQLYKLPTLRSDIAYDRPRSNGINLADIEDTKTYDVPPVSPGLVYLNIQDLSSAQRQSASSPADSAFFEREDSVYSLPRNHGTTTSLLPDWSSSPQYTNGETYTSDGPSNRNSYEVENAFNTFNGTSIPAAAFPRTKFTAAQLLSMSPPVSIAGVARVHQYMNAAPGLVKEADLAMSSVINERCGDLYTKAPSNRPVFESATSIVEIPRTDVFNALESSYVSHDVGEPIRFTQRSKSFRRASTW